MAVKERQKATSIKYDQLARNYWKTAGHYLQEAWVLLPLLRGILAEKLKTLQ